MMFAKLEGPLRDCFSHQDFDSLAISAIDFRNRSFEVLELTEQKDLYYDLASVSKVLTLASTYITKPEIFDDSLKLLINHQAGLPAWGLLPKSSWRQQILSYPIKKSPTLYSDFSALRAMLEIEKKIDISLHQHCKTFWDDKLCFWKDLPKDAIAPQTGFRGGRPISGEVHDPNAYNISEFCSHAGIFSTIGGLSKTLIGLDRDYCLLEKVEQQIDESSNFTDYVVGWNRRSRPEVTLAGAGAGDKTFGHLGFTGTSVWIDPQSKRGVVVLSNATQKNWYERKGIDSIRKMVGTFVFQEL